MRAFAVLILLSVIAYGAYYIWRKRQAKQPVFSDVQDDPIEDLNKKVEEVKKELGLPTDKPVPQEVLKLIQEVIQEVSNKTESAPPLTTSTPPILPNVIVPLIPQAPQVPTSPSPVINAAPPVSAPLYAPVNPVISVVAPRLIGVPTFQRAGLTSLMLSRA